eukprot:GHVL01035507.1.p1 GENE.GHVL01035507.1~~GHVL01035507.1.p1  ORF type:complete len:143 (-),score=45.56 GHVL01035507.1:194-622(-)
MINSTVNNISDFGFEDETENLKRRIDILEISNECLISRIDEENILKKCQIKILKKEIKNFKNILNNINIWAKDENVQIPSLEEIDKVLSPTGSSVSTAVSDNSKNTPIKRQLNQTPIKRQLSQSCSESDEHQQVTLTICYGN